MIHILIVKYATYKNNVVEKEVSERPVTAFVDEEEAIYSKKRLLKKDEQERKEWFKKHEYGIFIEEIKIEKIMLME